MDVYNMYVGDCASTYRNNMFRDYEKHPYGECMGPARQIYFFYFVFQERLFYNHNLLTKICLKSAFFSKQFYHVNPFYIVFFVGTFEGNGQQPQQLRKSYYTMVQGNFIWFVLILQMKNKSNTSKHVFFTCVPFSVHFMANCLSIRIGNILNISFICILYAYIWVWMCWMRAFHVIVAILLKPYICIYIYNRIRYHTKDIGLPYCFNSHQTLLITL